MNIIAKIFKKIANWFKPKEEVVPVMKPCVSVDMPASSKTLNKIIVETAKRPTINTRVIQARPVKSTTQTTTTVVETQNNNDDLLLGALAAATLLGSSDSCGSYTAEEPSRWTSSYVNDFSSSLCDSSFSRDNSSSYDFSSSCDSNSW